MECCPAGLARYGQISMMGLQYAVGNAQAEAGARYLLPYGGASEKPLKNAFLFPLRNSLPMIGDIQTDGVLILLHPNF